MKKRLLVRIPRDIELLRSLHPGMFLSMDSTIRRYKKAVMKNSSLNKENESCKESRKGPDKSCSWFMAPSWGGRFPSLFSFHPFYKPPPGSQGFPPFFPCDPFFVLKWNRAAWVFVKISHCPCWFLMIRNYSCGTCKPYFCWQTFFGSMRLSMQTTLANPGVKCKKKKKTTFFYLTTIRSHDTLTVY